MDNVNRAPDRVPSTEKTILKVGTLLGKCSSGHFRKVALGTGESTAPRMGICQVEVVAGYGLLAEKERRRRS